MKNLKIILLAGFIILPQSVFGIVGFGLNVIQDGTKLGASSYTEGSGLSEVTVESYEMNALPVGLGGYIFIDLLGWTVELEGNGAYGEYNFSFRNVVNHRRLTKTSIGFKSIELERAIRAHANFCETVPISFFLSLLLYFNNLLIFAVPAIIILCVGRTIHAISVSDVNEDLTKRRRGMRLTIFSIYIQILGILYYIFQLIYIFIKSLEILFKIQEKYSLVKVIPLKRDKRRKLGETRNISVRAARGKYVLLHIDTDDIWEPYIKTFTKIYHDLEKRLLNNGFKLSKLPA